MTIGRTILFSLFFHSLALGTVALTVKQAVHEGRLFTVEITGPLAEKTEERKGTVREALPKVFEPALPAKTAKALAAPVPKETIPEDQTASLHAAQPAVATESEIRNEEPEKNEGMAVTLGSPAQPHASASGENANGRPAADDLANRQSPSGPVLLSGDLVSRLRAAIERSLQYPPVARKRGFEGTVVVRFTVNDRGMPQGITVVEGSPYRILNEEAALTVHRAAPLPQVRGTVEIPIIFRLHPVP